MHTAVLMNVAIFVHAPTMHSNSMPRFANMLKKGLEERNIHVRIISSGMYFSRWIADKRLQKWLSYIDQFIIFPVIFKLTQKDFSRDTLFIFSDQALGPWVPLVKNSPHVIHCHDFLALRSALGEFPENKTSLTGKAYQALIRWGFCKGRNFISVSGRTQNDLKTFGPAVPALSTVVWNGLNFPFKPLPRRPAMAVLESAGLPITSHGMLLNIAGDQWYKNRVGLIRIYAEYVKRSDQPLPLWCVGPPPDGALQAELAQVAPRGAVHFLQGLDVNCLEAAYSCAAALLFPSLEEGFGWPIIEAQACGCPVFTTDAPPMNEIGGPAAFLMPRRNPADDAVAWQQACVDMLSAYLAQPQAERDARRESGLRWAAQFDAETALNAYFAVYESVVRSHPSDKGLLYA